MVAADGEVAAAVAAATLGGDAPGDVDVPQLSAGLPAGSGTFCWVWTPRVCVFRVLILFVTADGVHTGDVAVSGRLVGVLSFVDWLKHVRFQRHRGGDWLSSQ